MPNYWQKGFCQLWHSLTLLFLESLSFQIPARSATMFASAVCFWFSNLPNLTWQSFIKKSIISFNALFVIATRGPQGTKCHQRFTFAIAFCSFLFLMKVFYREKYKFGFLRDFLMFSFQHLGFLCSISRLE